MPRSILLVTNRAPWPLQDGGAMAMYQLITGYKRQGWMVHLLSMNTLRHWVEEDELRAAYAMLDSVATVPFDNRLRPVRLARNLLLSRQPEHAERFYSAAFEQTLLETLHRVRPDVVQMESLFLSGYLPALRAVSDAALVLRMHNVEHQIWSRAACEAKGSKRLYLRSLARRMRRYELWAWKQYDLLLPITPDDVKAVRDAGCKTSLHLTPFGMQTNSTLETTAESSPNSLLKLYHLGAMDWLPNREAVARFIAEIWPCIRAENLAAEFHFGGRLLEKEFAAPLPVGVFNHGPVDDAVAFAAEMDVLVVPLRSGGGIRVKILEAMAAGKLVISTCIGIQGIAAQPGKHFIQADTPEEFAAAVRWITNSLIGVREMRMAARKLVEDLYSADSILAGLSDRLHHLLQERR